jgi:signal transduction histidine kinase
VSAAGVGERADVARPPAPRPPRERTPERVTAEHRVAERRVARRWRLRLARRGRDAMFYGAILVTASLVALTIYQKWCHLQAQRQAMRQAVQDKAFDVAMAASDVLRMTDVSFAAALLGSVQGSRREPGAPPIALAGLTRYAQERMDSIGVRTDSLFGLFRIDAALAGPTDAALEASGAVRDDPAVRATVLAILARNWTRFAEPSIGLTVSTKMIRGEPVRVHMVRELSTDGRTLGIYGVVTPRRKFAELMVRKMVLDAPLLSASFFGHDWSTGERVTGRPADRGMMRVLVRKGSRRDNQLLALQVADSAGRLLHETPGAGAVIAASPYAAEVVFPGDNIAVRAAFRREDGDRLVAATVAAARDQWLMIGIAALGALFVAAAILELRRQHQLAEDRRNFVAAVSHELRTPLAHLAVLSETLIGPAPAGEEQQRRWLGVINREAHRLARLVDNVLLHARGDERELTLDLRWVNACELVEEVAVALGDVARARRARLSIAAPADCPVRVDPGALRQVLINLVDNAVKYGPDGQLVTVTVVAPGGGAGLTITVDDEGPGVAPRDARRIWKPFVRLGDRGGATGGSGLGLSVVRDLVRRHGGRVEVTRAPRGGARFVVELPQPAGGAPAER